MRGSLPTEPTLTGSGVSRRITYRLAAVLLLAVFLIQARPLLIPLVLAALLAFLVYPVVRTLTRRGLPPVVAILVAQGIATLPITGLGLVFAANVGALVQKLPEYQVLIQARLASSHGGAP